VRLGLLVIIAGLCGFALALRHTTPVWAAVAAWSLAGLGMGLAYAPTTLIMLHESPPGREGWASASISLADVLGTALGAGLGGAAVAAGSSHGALPTGVTAAFVVAAVGGLVALALTWRIPSGRPAATGV
jgi:MFS family permease